MAFNVDRQCEIVVGRQILITSIHPSNDYGVVFEDDGETGYLYAVRPHSAEHEILDALMIYRVPDDSPSTILKIVWSSTTPAAALLIRGEPQAVVDFGRRRAGCRMEFPAADPQFTETHAWTEDLYDPFR